MIFDNESPYFPDDVVVHILTKLPVKSLFVVRTACKRWYFLSLESHFIHLYNQCSSKNPKILIELNDSSKSGLGLIFTDHAKGVSELSWSYLKDRVKVRASCNGLLCCSSIPDKDTYYICNPMTRESRLLPRCRERPATRFYPNGEATLIGLAPEVHSHHYSVVLAGHHRSFGRRSDGRFVCFIFSSSSNKWRKFVSFQEESFTQMNKNQVVYSHGNLHWLTSAYSHVLALDLKCDMWRKIELPDDMRCVGSRGYLLEKDNELCVIQILEFCMKIWVMKEYESGIWSLGENVSLRCIRSMVHSVFPIGASSEVVFLATHKQILVYYCNTKVWKELFAVKNNSIMPLSLSAHAFKSSISPCK